MSESESALGDPEGSLFFISHKQSKRVIKQRCLLFGVFLGILGLTGWKTSKAQAEIRGWYCMNGVNLEIGVRLCGHPCNRMGIRLA